jgi:uncharacterized membrane protein
MEDWTDYVTLATFVGAGVVAGVWFAFSGFVMQALSRLPDAEGTAAMQSINVTAVRAPLMIAMFGVALAAVALGAWAALNLSDSRAPWLLAGAVVYIVGTIVVTIAGNVPLNDALMQVAPDSEEAKREWAHYLDAWTTWNHVRTVTGVAATALLAVGLVQD